MKPYINKSITKTNTASAPAKRIISGSATRNYRENGKYICNGMLMWTCLYNVVAVYYV